MEIKARTMLGQAIDVFKKYIETQGNLETDYHLEKYMKVVLDYINDLEVENKQLKKQLLVAQTNEETFRLEMEDITKTLGLDENTLFDDVKVCVKSLKDNWNKLKEYMINNINNRNGYKVAEYEDGGKVSETISPIYTLMEDKSTTMKEVLRKIQELEKGSDNQ